MPVQAGNQWVLLEKCMPYINLPPVKEADRVIAGDGLLCSSGKAIPHGKARRCFQQGLARA